MSIKRTKMRLMIVVVILGTLLSGHRLTAAQPPQVPDQRAAQGEWYGTIVSGQTRLRLVLKIVDAGAGQLKATMDSPDQGATDLLVDTITFKDGRLHFEMKALSILYDGAINKEGTEFAGTFTQGGSVPLSFKKGGVAKSQATVQRGRVALKLCDNPLLTSDALCGTYEVFEDRVARSGRKIPLNIVLLPAAAPKPAADPVFYLTGGPGGAATSSASETRMEGLRRNRDVVLVDQRGTGRSNPLNCTSPGSKQDMRGYFGEVMPVEWVRACRAELEKVANLKLYNSSIAMDDLDEVRGALGYDRIDLYGASYGSTAALVYLRQHPEHVRTVAVFGVAPPSAKLPLSFAKGVQDSMNRLFADCAANAECHAAFPNSAEEFKKILTRFDAGPVDVDVPNVYTRETEKVRVTRDSFVDGIRQLLYVPEAASGLPLLIHLGAEGNLGPLLGTAFQVITQIDSKISRGMQFSVICAEDIPFITEDDLKKSNANSFYGDARTRPTIRACAEWPSGKVPATFLEPVKSDVPVLLISGELDPVTPPWLAETAARSLSKSKVVTIKNGTHTGYACIENLVNDFIDKGTTEGLDYSCVDKITRPPFTIGRGQ